MIYVYSEKGIIFIKVEVKRKIQPKAAKKIDDIYERSEFLKSFSRAFKDIFRIVCHQSSQIIHNIL